MMCLSVSAFLQGSCVCVLPPRGLAASGVAAGDLGSGSSHARAAVCPWGSEACLGAAEGVDWLGLLPAELWSQPLPTRGAYAGSQSVWIHLDSCRWKGGPWKRKAEERCMYLVHPPLFLRAFQIRCTCHQHSFEARKTNSCETPGKVPGNSKPRFSRL